MIATAEELREASEMYRVSRKEKSKEELLRSWEKNFEKSVDRVIKDAVRVGAEVCSVQLPWQPGKNKQKFMRDTRIDGLDLRVWVESRLPGCKASYVEEEFEEEEDDVWYVMEISWAKIEDEKSISDEELELGKMDNM